MALLPGHIQYSPVFVGLSFLVFLLTFGKCRSLLKRKIKLFCVQEFSADIVFHEMTWQGGKLGVLYEN